VGGEQTYEAAGVSIAKADAVVERLRAAVESNRIVSGTFHGPVTISLGVAERTDEMAGIDDLLAAADRAVYEAKSQGRNRVCSADRPRGWRDSA